MVSLKTILSVAAVLSFSWLVGCAAQTEPEQEEPVEVAVEKENTIDPNNIWFKECNLEGFGGLMLGNWGVRSGPGRWPIDFGVPVTAQECTAWCTTSCGYSAGIVQYSYDGYSYGGFSCMCR